MPTVIGNVYVVLPAEHHFLEVRVVSPKSRFPFFYRIVGRDRGHTKVRWQRAQTLCGSVLWPRLFHGCPSLLGDTFDVGVALPADIVFELEVLFHQRAIQLVHLNCDVLEAKMLM